MKKVIVSILVALAFGCEKKMSNQVPPYTVGRVINFRTAERGKEWVEIKPKSKVEIMSVIPSDELLVKVGVDSTYKFKVVQGGLYNPTVVTLNDVLYQVKSAQYYGWDENEYFYIISNEDRRYYISFYLTK